jgi:hypothetical protein
MDKKQQTIVTTENIFDNYTFKAEKDFTDLAINISKNINNSNRPKKYTHSYIKNIVELVSPSLDSIKTNDLMKFLTLAIVEKKKEEVEKKAKGIVEDGDKPIQNIVSTKGNMDDDFF